MFAFCLKFRGFSAPQEEQVLPDGPVEGGPVPAVEAVLVLVVPVVEVLHLPQIAFRKKLQSIK